MRNKSGNKRPWEAPWDTRARENAGSISEFRDSRHLNDKLRFNSQQNDLDRETLEERVIIPDPSKNELADNSKRPYILEVTDAALSYALNILAAPMKLAASLIPSKARVPLAMGFGAFAFACSSGGGTAP